jgi:hypothetical protein
MLQMFRKKNKASNSLVAYLLSSLKNYRDHVAELLTASAEQRLVRTSAVSALEQERSSCC